MTTINLLKKLSLTIAGAGLIAVGVAETAYSAAINFTSPTEDFTNGYWSLGFKFTTNQKITVNSLGFYDDQKNDLAQTHDVGIFDQLGNLLVSGTVKPGDILDGWFRYTSVTPTVLEADKTFVIAAVTGSENYTWNPIGFTVDPNINYVSSAYIESNTLSFPIDGDTTTGYFGPNFKAESTSVPEPASVLGLLAFGALGATSLKRKQQQKTTFKA